MNFPNNIGLRDWFAGLAFQSLFQDSPGSPKICAKEAYEVADMLLLERGPSPATPTTNVAGPIIIEKYEELNRTHLSAEEYARQRGLSLRTVRNLIQRGLIKHERAGRRILIPIKDNSSE